MSSQHVVIEDVIYDPELVRKLKSPDSLSGPTLFISVVGTNRALLLAGQPPGDYSPPAY
jgi:hypothetical protein